VVVPALLALALFTSPLTPGGQAPVKSRPVVVVRGGEWTGSGIVWDADARRVLTALHVVEEMPADRIEVVTADGSALRARVVDSEPMLDLALLEVSGELGEPPPLGAASDLAPGSSVALASCPGARCALGDGRVILAGRQFAGSRYLSLAASALPGSSGGAVLDPSGAVVGIVDLTLVREPGVALAVPAELAARRFPRS
jgi:S1-C subfamily serine protease